MPEKVLIIEDTRSFAAILQQLIHRTHHFDSDIVESLSEARKAIANHPEKYFVAIVDLNLPDAPNGETVDLTVGNKIPSIVFTGSSDRKLKEDLWKKGISDYASKSGSHSLEYVVWMIKRIYSNREVGILVVDDSPLATKGMEKLLKTQKFRIYTAHSGEQALASLEKNPNIRVAILDCVMEGMDGFQLATAIRERFPSEALEIIGISSQEDRSLPAQFIKSGADDFLLKPFLPEEFLCRINHAVDRTETFTKLRKLNEEKNQFLGTAAHDIRGPIGAIKTATDYLLKRQTTHERQETLLTMISSSSSDLLLLLETLLDVTAIESGKLNLNKENTDLSLIVEERIELYHSEAELKSIDIETNIAPNISGMFDAIKIKQVVDNLITNALKYSPEKSSIHISLVSDELNIKLVVSDSGPGIAEDEQEHLFKPFRVLSTATTGGEKKRGLGLAIAKKIVDAHEGELYYEDGKPGGASFCVNFPLNKK